MSRLLYLRRVSQAYLGGKTSQLTFWHEVPALNEKAFLNGHEQFYMTFHEKARYQGPFDGKEVPLLDYRGVLGRQHNPIAIAQYGLGCFNLHADSAGAEWKSRFLRVADWMVDNLRPNRNGLSVWFHHFDWEYFRVLKAPWYSGLAQGQGLAVLVRAFKETGNEKYKKAAVLAFEPLVQPIASGGTLFVDQDRDWWIEEYITDPPTHILNGFIWALWGVHDYGNAFNDPRADELWERSLVTLQKNLGRFDVGHWSRYDLAPTTLPNVASPFYHSLHLVQLEVMSRLTDRPCFKERLERWRSYSHNLFCRRRAWLEKAVFKVLYF